MDLRAIVNRAVQVANADQPIQWLQYQSYSVVTGGLATPVYAPAQTVSGQIQTLSTGQLLHMEQLNIQGVLRAVYLTGAVAAAVRVDQTGGDLLQFPEIPGGPVRTWLVVEVAEQWPTWCRLIVKLQNDT